MKENRLSTLSWREKFFTRLEESLIARPVEVVKFYSSGLVLAPFLHNFLELT